MLGISFLAAQCFCVKGALTIKKKNQKALFYLNSIYNTEIDRFAQLLAQSTPAVSKADWGQRLAKLEKGQCWSLGPVLKSGGTFKEEAVLVSVTPLEERPCED